MSHFLTFARSRETTAVNYKPDYCSLRRAPEKCMACPPRPDLTSDAVIVRAVLQVEDELTEWVRKRLTQAAPKEQVVALVTVAIKETGADGFRAAHRLMESCGWPADYGLCRMIQSACDQLPFARRLVVMEWVMANNVRFPVEAGELVEWKANGKTRTGLVYAVNRSEAAAVVYPTIGSAVAGDMVKVVAEQVVRSRKVTKAG